MQILLLLSALLSAVTGAFAAPRPDGVQAEASIHAAAQPAARAEAEAPRAAAPCPQSEARAAVPIPSDDIAIVAPALKDVCLIE